MKLPVVFVFDLDATLVGGTDYIYAYDYFLTFIKGACDKKKIGGPYCSYKIPRVQEKISSEMLRPGMKESMTELKTIFPTAEFFIYSAGSTEHVKLFVDFVEKSTGITFNRPLLCRPQCVFDERHYYLKSLASNINVILGCLDAKYPGVTEKDLNGRIVIIDDQDVWGDDTRVIKCPEYKYNPVIEFDDKLIHLMYSDDKVKTYLKNESSHTLPTFHSDPSANIMQHMQDYHLYMANVYRQNLVVNTAALADTFFPDFVKALKPLTKLKRPFSEKSLNTIRKTIQNKK